MVEIDKATEPDGLGGAMIRVKPAREPESGSKSGWEGASEVEPRITYAWDRGKQAWVEKIEKPTVEEFSTANGAKTRVPVEPQKPSASPAPVAHKVGWPMSARKLLAARASVVRVIDAVALKSKAPKPSAPEADTRERPGKQATGIISEARQGAEQLPIMITGTIEEQVQDILGKVRDDAQEIKEKAKREAPLAKQVEEKAEAKVEGIIARAQEKARAQAERIIAQVEEKAEAKVEGIIARAQEKARAQAERIIAQVEEKAEWQVETIAAEAKAVCQETVSAAQHQAQHILKTAEEKAQQMKAPAKPTAKAVPEQAAPRQQEGSQKERAVPYEGTAELVIGPPVDLGKMQKLLNRLTEFDQIRVLDLEGSKGKGISVKLFSRNLARLPDILLALPGVERVSDLPRKVGKICPSQWICPGLGKGNEPPARRLLVTMEKRTTYTWTSKHVCPSCGTDMF